MQAPRLMPVARDEYLLKTDGRDRFAAAAKANCALFEADSCLLCVNRLTDFIDSRSGSQDSDHRTASAVWRFGEETLVSDTLSGDAVTASPFLLPEAWPEARRRRDIRTKEEGGPGAAPSQSCKVWLD